MQLKEVCVLGGSGFVGSAIVTKLDAAGYAVKVLTRRTEFAKHLFLLPNVKIVECNIMDYQALNAELRGADVVINLIGILHQSRKHSFNAMHHQLPAQVAKLCADLGIKRLLHMSSLGADAQAPSQYLVSKALGERAIQALSEQVNITVFKPSIVFGRGDRFINLFATLIKLMPVVLLAKPNAKFQPIWVEDVASCFVSSIENIDTYHQTYALAGPKIYTFNALLQIIMQTIHITRPIIGLNNGLSYAQAFMMELLPVKLMSRDNVKSMEVDSVSNAPFPPIFGITPTALEAVIPEYLVNETPRGAYDKFRSHAAR